MFAVIGAKLSEGLNFSDELARAVIIIGLPFPNLGSSELQERMKFVRRKFASQQQSQAKKDPGAELYENICMNSVNQSIGIHDRFASPPVPPPFTSLPIRPRYQTPK